MVRVLKSKPKKKLFCPLDVKPGIGDVVCRMSQSFITTRRIKFDEGDPAKIVFFAHVLTMAHETFEEFIVAAGWPWERWFSPTAYYVPIRHVECDYKAPFVPGQNYQVEAVVARMGETSFQMQYTFRQGSVVHAVVKMAHAFIDKNGGGKMRVPDDVRALVGPYLVMDVNAP